MRKDGDDREDRRYQLFPLSGLARTVLSTTPFYGVLRRDDTIVQTTNNITPPTTLAILRTIITIAIRLFFSLN